MALGWLGVLQLVPWADVIKAAPQVAGGARKLWDAVSTRSAAEALLPAELARTPEAMLARIERHEAALSDLHAQMLAASELLTRLADQNAKLVLKAESDRIRTFWQVGLLACVTSVSLGLSIYLAI